MKSQQRVNERGFAGAVGPEQSNRSSAKITTQIFEYRPSAKRHAQAVKVDDRFLDHGFGGFRHHLGRRIRFNSLGHHVFHLCVCEVYQEARQHAKRSIPRGVRRSEYKLQHASNHHATEGQAEACTLNPKRLRQPLGLSSQRLALEPSQPILTLIPCRRTPPQSDTGRAFVLVEPKKPASELRSWGLRGGVHLIFFAFPVSRPSR